MFYRERTQSFYAETETEFEKIINNEDNFSPRRKKKRTATKTQIEEEEFENLLFKSNYVMEKETPSLEEQMKNEEKELFIFLKKLNNNHSNNSDIESDNTDSTENDLINYKKSHSNSNIFFSEEEINNIIIPNNVKNFSKNIKLMVIGKSGVGKSFLVNKFIDNKDFDEKKYLKTENFEIKKIVVEFNENNNIQFELWDTSEKFINSCLISTYFKIANAFLFVIDENTTNEFVINQINQIKKFVQNPKIFFINNIRNKNNNNNNNNICKKLLKNFNLINLNFYNIKNLFKNFDFNLFIENFIEKKTFKKICNNKNNNNYINNNINIKRNRLNIQKDFYDEEKFLIKINN